MINIAKKIVCYPFLLLFFMTLFLGVGYAQITSKELQIDGTAKMSGQTGLLITGVEYLSGTGVNPSQSSINSFFQTLIKSQKISWNQQ